MEQSIKTFRAGETIFRAGDPGDVAYFIQSGRVEIAGAQRRVLGTVGENTVIGEMALIDPAPRMASATAIEDCECRVISRKHLTQIVDDAEPLVGHLLRSMIRTQRQRVGAKIQTDELSAPGANGSQDRGPFRSYANPNVISDRRLFNAGTRVFREGGYGDAVYMVQSGEVEVRKAEEGGVMAVLRRFGPGEVFGELAVLQNTERAAAAFAVTSTTCEVLTARAFLQIVKDSPPVLAGFIRIYAGTF
jgi:CRP-like cAMP-binding protein